MDEKEFEKCKAENKKTFYKWIGRIEDIISLHRVRKGEVSQGWIYIFLLDYLFARAEHVDVEAEGNKKKKGQPYDGVMHLAFSIGTLLMGWSMRTQLAKCYDPRRPAKHRNIAYSQYLMNITKILQIIDNKPNELDKKIYKQKWQPTKFIKADKHEFMLAIDK